MCLLGMFKYHKMSLASAERKRKSESQFQIAERLEHADYPFCLYVPFPDQLQILTGGRIAATAFYSRSIPPASVHHSPKGQTAQKDKILSPSYHAKQMNDGKSVPSQMKQS